MELSVNAGDVHEVETAWSGRNCVKGKAQSTWCGSSRVTGSSLLAPPQRLPYSGHLSRASKMDELVKESIATVEQRKKTSVPWTIDEPHDQPYHRFENGKWEATTPKTEHADPAGTLKPSDKLALYTWNIDFMLPYPDSRMRAAIHHLETLCRLHPPTMHPVIFLQECLATDLTLLASSPWIQANFHLTDLTPASWASAHYGTTTLLSNRLSPSACFRIHYSNSEQQRDVLVLDIPLSLSTTTTTTTAAKPLLLRLCNTHLESLPASPPLRPHQLALCAQHMQNLKTLHASILAGDLNAIQSFDAHLPSAHGLKDAYLELGGQEDDAEGGHTWGQQASTALREKFGTSRMDKVLFCGDGVVCEEFERFGGGVEVEDAGERRQIVGLGFGKGWITDHLGVKAVFGLQSLMA
ncbi:hypothetical protein LTR91_003384 [Friedmanniomyces endolithicus]|uniref:Endonuclease/exonuclease/phosphatase domain-containing protein n=1 Tax=Friedmanniomyces endolithicus TaxID=329885 RepID=A0AAN6KYA7_9PEZI|nr:hypothetical protein LTR75_015450 [Friedmanniomyces endolithicus]KAK0837099.1 hypothetical protein LTS02_018022 [Friedmanniomyces endolithicus]KAK0844752.1 hypothetical protein LTR03_007917 [Friedmanniomyces endolithicus]KAK0883557.1 hypothetical protein LTR87_002564 [Friedmanniomyces endolithicus]KAK0889664.1 hypothetical protein LTR02_015298 [Friedmanniomyces endolithicus]